MMIFALSLALPTLLILLLQLNPTQAVHAVCTWKDSDAGRTSPHHAKYSYYCDAAAKVVDADHVIYECYGMHVADWGYSYSDILDFASPCAPGDGYSPDCDYQFWGVCIGDARPHHKKRSFECFYMDGRDSCEWPQAFDAQSRPQSVQIWHKKGGPGVEAGVGDAKESRRMTRVKQ